MATFTTKLGLRKPAPAGEFVNVATDLNANADDIDSSIGTLWVNDGVIPPNSDLYNGRQVREITSGKEFTAKDNGSGGFTLPATVGKANAQYGYWTFSAAITTGNHISIVNGSTTAISNTFAAGELLKNAGSFTLTRQGLYIVNLAGNYAVATGAWRRLLETRYTSSYWDTDSSGAADTDTWSLCQFVAVQTGAPQTLTVFSYQDSGITRTCIGSIRIMRIDVVI